MPISFSRKKWVRLEAIGTTPLAQSLVYYLQKCVLLNQKKKICIIITDGASDNQVYVKHVIYIAKMMCVDIYGVGIQYDLSNIISDRKSIKINNIIDISSKLFELHNKI